MQSLHDGHRRGHAGAEQQCRRRPFEFSQNFFGNGITRILVAPVTVSGIEQLIIFITKEGRRRMNCGRDSSRHRIDLMQGLSAYGLR